MTQTNRLFLFIAVCLIALVPQAKAMKTASDQDLQQLLQPVLLIETAQRAAAKINHHQGSMALKLNKIELHNAIASLSYEQLDFDWQKIDQLPFGDGTSPPIQTIHRLRGHIRLPCRLDENRLLLAELSLANTYEQGAKDDWSWESYLLYSKARDQRDSWQFGIFVQQSAVEVLVLPIIELTYNFNNPLREGMYGHLGFPKTQVGVHLTPKWRTELEAVYFQATTKLSADNSIQANGYAQVKSWRTQWVNHYLILPNLELSFALKRTLIRNWINYDASQNKQTEHQVENAPSVSFGLQYRF